MIDLVDVWIDLVSLLKSVRWPAGTAAAIRLLQTSVIRSAQAASRGGRWRGESEDVARVIRRSASVGRCGLSVSRTVCPLVRDGCRNHP